MTPNKTILLVEDDDAARDALSMLLSDAGYSVAAVGNGIEALRHLRESSELPCVIVLDLIMPRMDGWEFRARQQADPELAGIPVVVITAASVAKDPIPAAEVLKKPLDFDAVMNAVGKYC